MKVKFEFETGDRNWKEYHSHNIDVEDETEAIEEACKRVFKCKEVSIMKEVQGIRDVWKMTNFQCIEKLGRIRSIEVEE